MRCIPYVTLLISEFSTFSMVTRRCYLLLSLEMYLPTHFSENRTEVMHELIRACPLAVLVTIGSRGLEANHIPFYLHLIEGGSAALLGHVARANPVWNLGSSNTALAIFQGPSSYIRPGWYPSKKEHGKVVPTWNYIAVHVQGTLKSHHDPQWIRAQLERLTNQMESTRAKPWSLADAPSDYLDKLIANVVGIELTVDRLVGKWKLSQNQPEANRAGVVAGLEADGDSTSVEMARLVAGFLHAVR